MKIKEKLDLKARNEYNMAFAARLLDFYVEILASLRRRNIPQ